MNTYFEENLLTAASGITKKDSGKCFFHGILKNFTGLLFLRATLWHLNWFSYHTALSNKNYNITVLDRPDSFTEKNIGPSSANQAPSTAVTHCMNS